MGGGDGAVLKRQQGVLEKLRKVSLIISFQRGQGEGNRALRGRVFFSRVRFIRAVCG